MRASLKAIVDERAPPFVTALGMEPQELAVIIDALGVGLAADHMLHGAGAVPADLFSKALALIVDGVASRGAATQAAGGDAT